MAVWLSCYAYIFTIWTYLNMVNHGSHYFLLKTLSSGRSSLEDLKKITKNTNICLTNNYIYMINFLLKNGLTIGIFLWWEKLSEIWSDTRIFICFIILHDYSFFSKSVFGVTICWLVVNRCKFCVNCFNHKSAVINNINFPKIMRYKIFIRWAKKNMKSLKKWKCQKCQRLANIFNI